MGPGLATELTGENLAAIDAGDVTAFLTLREALRSLFAGAVAGERLDGAAAAELNRAAQAGVRWRELRTDPSVTAAVRSAASPVAAVIAEIAEAATALLSGPRSASLRICAAPDCIRFFQKDHPRRAWCTPACSDRVRSARYYARSKATS